jgi:hypothetical protein
MENLDLRYLVQQNKVSDASKPPVFARVMRSKDGAFEGVMTVAEAQQVIDWAGSKKAAAAEYATKIICVGQ